jgi:exodeoxyribonuclease-3
MKIISFNVNGLRAALQKGFVEWLIATDADFVCLQEIKLDNFAPLQVLFENAGYQSYWMPAVKKGYSGVAILARKAVSQVQMGCGCEMYDNEGRVIGVRAGDVLLLNVYMPSGTTGPERQAFKMKWLEFFYEYVRNLRKEHQKFVICGDYNIAHQEIDIHNPKSNAKSSGFLPEEREWLTRFISLGLCDAFRCLNANPHHYTWWTYRAGARDRNLGWRIDYHMVSDPLREKLKNASILSEVRFSDHCPVLIELDD